jgi:hypothetical protein
MATRECEECKVVFEYTPAVGFPDKRKYCDDCSAKKKAEWAAKQGQKSLPEKAATQAVQAQAQAPKEYHVSHHDIVISRTEKPHSYEFGKAGQRHKIYYEKIEELLTQIQLLKNAGLVEPDIDEEDFQ